ncbi:MAG: hypothetical protein J6K98_03040 [Clostridia bacterium]|nr:hypothetical protein [Clostridia bacterium]
MSDARTEEFLDLYRRLEVAAGNIMGSNGRGSPVFRLEKHPDFTAFGEQLDCIREVRNFLSHEPKVGGEYAIHPSENMVETLRTSLERVENPPRVSDRMTPVKSMLTATRDTAVLPLMTEMEQRHISHVPILQNKRVDSVFSVSTVFQAALGGMRSLDTNTRVENFARWLPIDRHMGQDFRFVEPDMLLRDARNLFDKAYSRNRKLKLLLVTENARPDRPLLGVLSPYDLLNQD